jgi:hypothetical protein
MKFLGSIYDVSILAVRNTLGTFKSTFINSCTANRNITLQDKDYTLAGLDDLPVNATKTIRGVIDTGTQDMPSGQKTFWGAGSTSATKSLIVKNSTNIEAISISDDGFLSTSKPIKSQLDVYAGGNLIANGVNVTNDTYNYDSFTLDKLIIPLGNSSCYLFNNALANTDITLPISGIIPVDFSKKVELSMSFVIGNSIDGVFDPSNRVLVSLEPYDSDDLIIQRGMTARAGTNTYLTTELKNGDTSFTVNSTAGWEAGSSPWYVRALTWWPYQSSIGTYAYIESSGCVNLPYSYSRNYIGADAYSGITGNVVTLTYPWSYGTLQAGTPVSQTWQEDMAGYFKYIDDATIAGQTIKFKCTYSMDSSLSPEIVLKSTIKKAKVSIRLIRYGAPHQTRVSGIFMRYI